MATRNITLDYDETKKIDLSGLNSVSAIAGFKSQQAKDFYKGEVGNIRFDYSIPGHSSAPNREKGEVAFGTKSVLLIGTIYCYGTVNDIMNDLNGVVNPSLSYSSTDSIPNTSASGKTLVQKGKVTYHDIFSPDDEKYFYYGIYAGEVKPKSWWDSIKGKLGLAALGGLFLIPIMKLPEKIQKPKE